MAASLEVVSSLGEASFEEPFEQVDQDLVAEEEVDREPWQLIKSCFVRHHLHYLHYHHRQKTLRIYSYAVSSYFSLALVFSLQCSCWSIRCSHRSAERMLVTAVGLDTVKQEEAKTEEAVLVAAGIKGEVVAEVALA